MSFVTILYSTTTHSSNHWIYNLFLPAFYEGLLLVFYKASALAGVKRFNGWLLVILPVIAFLCWA